MEKVKYYSEKQSYYGGYYTGKVACMDLTKSAEPIDGWVGLPVGFNWKEYKRGFSVGWQEAKLLHYEKESGSLLDSSSVLNTEFARTIYEAVENAQKVY